MCLVPSEFHWVLYSHMGAQAILVINFAADLAPRLPEGTLISVFVVYACMAFVFINAFFVNNLPQYKLGVSFGLLRILVFLIRLRIPRCNCNTRGL